MASTPSNLKRQRAATSGQRHSSSRIIGAGEMAHITRKFDWATTPLGPVETWSDTLVTTVNLLLASRHPMFLWWGPGLIQFYNDGYRPSIRADKHPSAVGQRGQECWPEIWHIIGPQIEAVMNLGESTWNLNQLVPIKRNGKLEEVYWTYSYSPVRDVEGSVQGTLVVCSETTEHVLSERRLRSLLSIGAHNSAPSQLTPSQPLLHFAKNIVKTLDENPTDIPFSGLYLVGNGEVLLAESALEDATADLPGGSFHDSLTNASRWPLETAIHSGGAVLLEDLQSRFGDVVRSPWPEPITQAYVLPVLMPGLSTQGVLVLGISPRLPFDGNYRTFFELVAARIAALLQSEVHQLELAEAAQRFSSLVEENPFGMVIGGLGGDVKYVNPAFLEALGYTDAEVGAGQVRWDNLTPPEYDAADQRALAQLRSTGRCDVYEKAFLAKDGRTVPVLIGASILGKSGSEKSSDPQVAAFVTDLTPLKDAKEALRKAYADLEQKVVERTAALEAEVSERKRAEMGLRELTGRLLVTQDEERRHMARELHDHAGQTLAVLTMNLSALRKAATDQNTDQNVDRAAKDQDKDPSKDRDGRIVQLAAESHQLSDALSREIRTFSYLLHPPLLDEVGLRSALPWYVEGFAERSKIKVDLKLSKGLGRLPKDLELVIFRVVQEALTNIHRHSGSSSASIQLVCSDRAVDLEVSDAGKGISPQRQRELNTARSGVGVRGMEERVRQFGGTLKISSSNQGAKVVVHLPLDAKPLLDTEQAGDS